MSNEERLEKLSKIRVHAEVEYMVSLLIGVCKEQEKRIEALEKWKMTRVEKVRKKKMRKKRRS